MSGEGDGSPGTEPEEEDAEEGDTESQ